MGDILGYPILAPFIQAVLAKANEGSPFENMEEDSDGYEMFEAMMRFMPLRAMAHRKR